MRIGAEQLAQRLQRQLEPLYTIFGGEDLLALEAADRLRGTARQAGYSEREVLIAEAGFDWSRLAMSAASLSLFGDKKLLELRIPTGKPGLEGAKAIEALAHSPPPDMVTLVLLPEMDRTSQQSKWFQALERAGLLVAAEPVGRDRLPQWLSGRLAAQKQSASADALQFIVDRVEGNLLAAFQEVQKLALLYPEGELTLQQVSEAVVDVSRYDVSLLCQAMLAADAPRLGRILDGLRGEGEAAPRVLAWIAPEIRALLAVANASAERKPLSEAMKRELRLWPARLTQVERAARTHDPKALARALAYAQQVDRIAKGLERGDAWEGLLQLVLAAANKPALTLTDALV
jgi:DNA polymerase III subunit delta